MKIIKTLLIVFSLSICISGCKKNDSPVEPAPQQYTDIGGRMNTILSMNKSPYRVTNTLIIDSSSTLTVEAGVRICFEDSTQMVVRGSLLCLGSPSQQILFTSKSIVWKGIQIVGETGQSILQFVIIENIDLTTLYDTVRNGAVDIIGANVMITNSIFRNNKSNNGGALAINHSASFISNNIFMNNYAGGFGGAFLSSSSSNSIINNTFYNNYSNNYDGGLLLLSPVRDSVQNNIFYANRNATGDPRISILQTDSTHFVAQYNFLQLITNPQFVSQKDFHLLSNSPCIHAGNILPQYNNDNGSRNDQGAYGGPLGNW